MIISDMDLHYLSGIAMAAAAEAGSIISSHVNKQLKVNTKSGKETLASQVVTEVDHLAQEAILKTITPTCNEFDLAVLAEESTDDCTRLEKDYFWCIDPMDGTLAFIEGTSGYAVSIALVSREGVPVIGVVYDPVEGVLYHAIKGHGAFRTGSPWQPLAAKKQQFTFTCDRSFTEHPKFDRLVNELEKIASESGYSGLNILKHGGAVMNACWVLENAPGCYIKFPKPKGGSLWDYAATACLYHELGAIATDINGNVLDLNRADSTYMNHHGILYASDSEWAKKIMDSYNMIMKQS